MSIKVFSKEFPSNADYTNIVKNLKVFISNHKLKDGKPLYSKTKRLISYAGGYSKVFPVKILNEKIALRFWTAYIQDSEKRYKEIDIYLKKKNLPYFVNFDYYHNELGWKGNHYSFISMKWVEGITLNSYLDNNINHSYKIEKLADCFLEMVQDLHENNIAHGDLQDGNILVIEKGNDIKLKLIDYDSIFVPNLKNFPIDVMGVEAYQHPKKNGITKISEKIDYFSELVIYLSLLAYSEDAHLWVKGQDQKLLFDAKDFINIENSLIFKKLKKSSYSSKIVELTLKLEQYCLKRNINELLPLEIIIEDKFKKTMEIFKDIKSAKIKPSSQENNKKFDKSIAHVKKIFSATNRKKEKGDNKKIDDKFSNAIKKMRG